MSKKPEPEKNILESFSFTTSEGNGAAIYLLVTEAGFPPTSAGVRDYLLFKAGMIPGASQEAEAENEGEEDLGENVRKILDALERNPEVTNLAIKKGTQILGSLAKKFLG